MHLSMCRAGLAKTITYCVAMSTPNELTSLMQGLTQMMFYILVYQSAKQAKQASAEGLCQDALQKAVAAHALPFLRRAHTLQLLVSGQSAATASSSAPCRKQNMVRFIATFLNNFTCCGCVLSCFCCAKHAPCGSCCLIRLLQLPRAQRIAGSELKPR